ncbi:putative DNA protection during starvation protein 2 [Bacteriovorax sp. BAL6_X]|uniref:Dps family protein n=1 Tax=Bacteriovorax sp. BAL6_X TaxID=1201290 RepID=UPI0003864B54|nr:DNA starvation/stationary phase protection protein [Bacteriovorax sp. BAL6_X]EPZ51289.1 putative DNA protection during starvation protein 2 [Bacteriovorax sp. BAL6_X]
MNTINQLKLIQADAQVYFMKLHNIHWNVTGMMFQPIHALTETLYNEFAIVFDDLAERQLQLGQKPVLTMSNALEISRIKETNESSFTSTQALELILKDNQYFLEAFRELSSTAGDENDATTVAYADEKVAWLEKENWQLRAMLE